VDTSNINFGRLTVKGADVQLQYSFPSTSYGQFVTSLAGTYVDAYEILVTPGTEPLNLVNHANTAGYPLRFKGNAVLSWSGLGGWSASTTLRYLNSYLDYDGVRKLPSQTLLDLQVGYRFGDESTIRLLKGFQATFGVINLTNHQGDFSNSFAGYDSLQADLRGRFYYLNLQTKF
jgi:iron complex outermembrane receptor protein